MHQTINPRELSDGQFAIYLFNPDGTFSTLAESLDAPADLGVDSKC